jgi:hypothetical protein
MLDLIPLLTAQLSTSELSDELCRQVLRQIVTRHSQALVQLEQAYNQDKGAITWLKMQK